MRKEYDAAKNPNDGKWYTIGYLGDGQWMPISNPFDTKKEALKHAKWQVITDRAHRRGILDWNGE